MISPTELTIATGTTVYAGDPESGERIVSREVRVSVTYRINDEDTDVTSLAYAKAAEVERARMAACERIGWDRCEPHGPGFDPSDPALEPPDEDGSDPGPFPEEADYLSARYGPVPSGERRENDDRERKGHSALPPASAGTWRPAAPGSVPGTVSEEETDWATRPQVLAIGSHFKRIGVGPSDQTALLRARFGKFRAERLTKDEAASLMRCLERGELDSSEYAAAAPAAR